MVRCSLSAVARFSSSFAADMMARTPPTTAPPMNAMMLNMLCNLQPKKSLGEINPPVVKFAGNAQPLGSLRVVAFKRLQEISGALGCVGALNDGGIVGPLVLFGDRKSTRLNSSH